MRQDEAGVDEMSLDGIRANSRGSVPRVTPYCECIRFAISYRVSVVVSQRPEV